LPGAHFGYAYDAAGNRTAVSVDSENANYAANNLNQVTARDTLKTRFSGTADASASVSVGSATVARQGRYWDAAPLNFGSNTQVNVSAVLGSQSQSASLWAIQRPASESLGYDLDGNLTGDSAWSYQYDAENRLVSMTTNGYAFAAPGAVQTITFAYDYLGRRVRKTETLNGSTVSDQKYVYHGWLLIAELTFNSQLSTFNLSRSYVWGLDASGTSIDGAGGVGGLVLETVHASSTLTPYGVAFDGNGNVAALVNTANSAFGAIYEYDPYGQLMHSEGAEAANNPFQFSTKYKDRETGLVYYGHRYYDPSFGRFINRDPSEEAGGLNLYGFVGNNSVNDWDYLGLDDIEPGPNGEVDRWVPNEDPQSGGRYEEIGNFGPSPSDNDVFNPGASLPSSGDSMSFGGGGSDGGGGSNTYPSASDSNNGNSTSLSSNSITGSVDKTAAQNQTIIDGATAALGAYKDHPNSVPAGYHRATAEELAQLGATPKMIQQMQQLNISVFINGASGNAIVAFAGTASLKDVGTDAANAFNRTTSQYQGAIEFAREFQHSVAPNISGSILLTGHSMGGGEAAAAALATGYSAMTFNASGVSSSIIHANGLDVGAANGLITNYHTSLDPVTYGERLTPAGGALGVQVTIPSTGIFTSGHSMTSVLSDLKAWH
jgi:RHS repeat-associated protein